MWTMDGSTVTAYATLPDVVGRGMPRQRPISTANWTFDPLRADLVNERWCLPPPDHPVGALVIEALKSIGLDPPQRAVSLGSALSTSTIVARGQYLGVLGSMFLHFNPPVRD
jgi:hypothetical protein